MADTTSNATRVRFMDIPDDLRVGSIVDNLEVEAEDGQVFSCVDPFDATEWGRVAVATPGDVDRAVASSRAAFEKWRHVPQMQRSAIVARWGQLILDNVEELARLQVHENGKTITEMRMATYGVGLGATHWARLAQNLHGMTVEPDMPNHRAWTHRKPLGVVAAITPWNNPLGLLGWKLFPAVATGNTVVVKPSEVTPVSTVRLVQLGIEAGLPEGVVNVVTGAGLTGKALAVHPDVNKVAFTGSTPTGRAIAVAAASRFAHTSLELGGKGPQIVFADADLDKAADSLVTGLTAGTGQACNAGSRLILHESVHDEVLARVIERATALRIGDPLDPTTEIGPLASRAQLEKVVGYLDIADQEGLNAVLGGKRATGSAELDRGFFVEPTIYDRVPARSRLFREEIFGPVGVVTTFESDAEAVQQANDTEFGLVGGFWTESLTRAHRIAEQLDVGVVWINTWRAFSNQVPFGGVKNSGIGREAGIQALEAFTEVKAVWLGMN